MEADKSMEVFRGMLDSWWRGVVGNATATPIARIKIEIEIGGGQSIISIDPKVSESPERKADDSRSLRDGGLPQTRGADR